MGTILKIIGAIIVIVWILPFILKLIGVVLSTLFYIGLIAVGCLVVFVVVRTLRANKSK